MCRRQLNHKNIQAGQRLPENCIPSDILQYSGCYTLICCQPLATETTQAACYLWSMGSSASRYKFRNSQTYIRDLSNIVNSIIIIIIVYYARRQHIHHEVRKYTEN